MRKKYTKWYINHMETVERSFFLRILHHWLFLPSVYMSEISKKIYFTSEKINEVKITKLN